MKESIEITKEYYASKLNRSCDSKGITNLDIIFDGTWMTKGFHSNIGIGVIIDQHTKLALDYTVLSKYCHKCSVNKSQKSDEDFAKWYSKHKINECVLNHKGSSAAMEKEALLKLVSDSLGKKIRYIRILSDGDSKAFTAVKQMNGGKRTIS